jgi:hypothetical protein
VENRQKTQKNWLKARFPLRPYRHRIENKPEGPFSQNYVQDFSSGPNNGSSQQEDMT